MKELLIIEIIQKDKKKLGKLNTKIRDLEVHKEEIFKEEVNETKGTLEYQTIIKRHEFTPTKSFHDDPSEIKISLTSLFKKVKSNSTDGSQTNVIPSRRLSTDLSEKSPTEEGFFFKIKKKFSLKNENSEPHKPVFRTPQPSPSSSPPRSPEVGEETEKKPRKRRSLIDMIFDNKREIDIENHDTTHNVDVNLIVQAEKIYKSFGKEIDELVKRDGGKYPKVFEYLINYLKKNHAEKENGIFRISPSMDELDDFIFKLDEENKVDTETFKDIHLYSTALKHYLKSLPSPIIPTELYDSFLETTKIEDNNILCEKLKELFSKIPQEKRDSIGLLLDLLTIISSNYRENKMTALNIAVVFGVNSLRAETKDKIDPMKLLKDSQKITNVFESFLIHYDKIKDVFM